jgi:hypothetical protein
VAVQFANGLEKDGAADRALRWCGVDVRLVH